MSRYVLVLILSTVMGVDQDVEVVHEMTYDRLNTCTEQGEFFKRSFEADSHVSNLSYMCVPVVDTEGKTYGQPTVMI